MQNVPASHGCLLLANMRSLTSCQGISLRCSPAATKQCAGRKCTATILHRCGWQDAPQYDQWLPPQPRYCSPDTQPLICDPRHCPTAPKPLQVSQSTGQMPFGAHTRSSSCQNGAKQITGAWPSINRLRQPLSCAAVAGNLAAANKWHQMQHTHVKAAPTPARATQVCM